MHAKYCRGANGVRPMEVARAVGKDLMTEMAKFFTHKVTLLSPQLIEVGAKTVRKLNGAEIRDAAAQVAPNHPTGSSVAPITADNWAQRSKNIARLAMQNEYAELAAKERLGLLKSVDSAGAAAPQMMPQNGDPTAQRFGWEMFILAGDPEQVATYYHPDTSENGWFACPDNCAFDAQGNLWIATDGADDFGIADGLWVAPVAGPNRGRPRHFLRTPRGAELCGPSFTPDFTSFFCAVQHPGDDGGSFDEPSTRWPDFHAGMPPRPAVLAIRHRDGRPVGS